MTLTKIFYSFILCLIVCGCKISSSFQPGTTANIIASSILIPLADNNAPQSPADLSINFTESLRDYYVTNSKLIINTNNASDLELYATIIGFSTKQILNSSSDNGLADQMELSLQVKIKYIDNGNESNNITTKTFSQKLSYDAEITFEDAQVALLPELTDLITQEIFNATLARW